MIRWSSYVRSCMKRAFILFPAIFLTVAVFVLTLGSAFFIMVKSNDDGKVRARVGLVGDTDDEYLGIGFLALEKLDSSRVAVEFIEYEDEQKAREDLKVGNLTAYVYVPEGFIDSVLSGENSPMTLVTADRTDDLIPAMIREMAGYASGYVTDSQRSIQAMRRAVREYDLREVELNSVTDDLNLRYITLITNRSSWCELVETGEMGTSSYGGYYLCSFVFIFLMLFSVMATPVFTGGRENHAYFKGYGVGPVKQIGAEFLSYGALALTLILTLFLCVGQFMPDGIIDELRDPLMDMLVFFFRALPFMLLIILMSHFLWELIPDTVNGVLLQFIMAVGIGYISGCFYPSNMFPEGVRTFASMLPTGVALSGIRDSLADRLSVHSVIPAFALSAALFVGTCLLRHYRLQKGGKE